METMGVPHSSTAFTTSSTDSRFRKMSVGCWIFPQPGHDKLQAKSGSISTMKGKRGSRCNFFLMK
jgi:hypothetical protein